MKNIEFLEGDATQPIGDGLKIIPHCCNNKGGWGSGFVVALSKRWEDPEHKYRELYSQHPEEFYNFLGLTQIVPVEKDIWVVNIIGQDGFISKDNPIPIKYNALECGLRTVGELAILHNASVHAPRLGCALAGGSWRRVESIIHKVIPQSVKVFIYDFPGGSFNP